MSDYLYMLESRLSAEQNRVLELAQAAANAAGLNLFLTGGAMRDLLGGFKIRDLDFSVEGSTVKIVKSLEEQGAQLVSADENRRTVELVFPSGVTAQVSQSRIERYAKTGAKPHVSPATIQEDLRGHDFTINAMALSLSRASRGLLLDPTNGLADLGHHEMRTTHPYVFYDDPSRLLRLTRLRVRLSFAVEDRTRQQIENARGAEVEKFITPRALLDELRRIADEPSPAAVIEALAADGLLPLFSPALAGPKMNLPALARLEKAAQLAETSLAAGPMFGPFLHALTDKLSPKEKAALFKAVELPKADAEQLRALEPHAHKLEADLKAPRVRKPSHVYEILSAARPVDVLFLLANSAHKTVQERIQNYLEKYVPLMREVPPADWETIEGRPGTPKYVKAAKPSWPRAWT